jgi:hypothetical protein
MGMNRNINENPFNNEKPKEALNNRNDHYIIDDITDDDYEEGEVNGFMMQRPLNTHNNGMTNSFHSNVNFTLLTQLLKHGNM